VRDGFPELGDVVRRAVAKERKESVPAGGSQNGRTARPVARDPDRDARRLQRLGQELRAAHGVPAAREVERLAAPQSVQDLESLVEQVRAPHQIGLFAERSPLDIGAAGAAESRAEDEPPVR
jgi:hypothetical protein